jgi:shikimate kinase
LRRPYIDVDREIENAAGCSISEIFDLEGEAAFRLRERSKVESCVGESAVVALGGGAISQRGLRDRLADTGDVVYLRARPETLLARLGDCRERPLLSDVALERRAERLEELLDARREDYESARFVVDTDGEGVQEIVETIISRLENGEER